MSVYEDEELEQEMLGLQVRETADGWRFDHRGGGYSDRAVAVAMALSAALKTRVRAPARTTSAFAVTRRRQERRRRLPEGFVHKGLGVVADPSLPEPLDAPPGWHYSKPRKRGYLIRDEAA